MDLSKAFDTLNHDLLKRTASLNYIQSYLHNRFQKTNANINFSLGKDIFAGRICNLGSYDRQ